MWFWLSQDGHFMVGIIIKVLIEFGMWNEPLLKTVCNSATSKLLIQLVTNRSNQIITCRVYNLNYNLNYNMKTN